MLRDAINRLVARLRGGRPIPVLWGNVADIPSFAAPVTYHYFDERTPTPRGIGYIVFKDIPLERVARRAEELHPELKDLFMEPLERAALAAAQAAGYTKLIDDPTEKRSLSPSELDGDEWRAVVRAVLEAIREPDDAMVRAGEAWQLHCSDVDSLFSEMIGVAIHGPTC